ncbi:MAG: pirin family protein [Verrucomicrobiota bacterium]
MTTSTTPIKIRRSGERGHADHGWLKSHHSFSFGSYHDPAHSGFRSLRVINQDQVAPGGGFPTHPHRDMEIFSYVLSGTLKHQDSMGNGRELKPGQIQLMSAGKGVAHSEFNPSDSEALHFLQIWLLPERANLEPSYTEWHPSPETEAQGKTLIISQDGRDESAVIHQDASIYRVRLSAGESVEHQLAQGRGLWLQLISGEVSVAQQRLEAGDGVSIEEPGSWTLTAESDSVEALLFDLR